MRRIFHISDLHFGRTDESVVAALTDKIHEVMPDVLVVSGDLTQRARSWQFRDARHFLDSFACPKIVIPGNHDVPLENLLDRFFSPLAKYRKYITDDLSPTFRDQELAIVGINTARSFTRTRGSINDRQIEHARQFFCSVDPDVMKIVVTHHPFDIPENLNERYLLRRSRHAIAALAVCQADLYLAGHSHVPFAGLSERRYTVAHHTALIVQAGTSASTRTRSAPNSFNLIRVDRPDLAVEHFQWDAPHGRFVSTTASHFRHTASGWHATAEDSSFNGAPRSGGRRIARG
jgi:3',5'-cyclic AMP phosphodiesterase CpdA